MTPSTPHRTRVFPVAAIVFAATLLFTYLMGVVAIDRGQQVDAERTLVQHLEEVGSSLDDAETGQRSYLLTENPRYLQSYRRALAQLSVAKGVLRADAVAGAYRQASVEMLFHDLEGIEAEMASTLQIRRENGFEAALAKVRTGRGETLTDAITKKIEDLKVGIMSELGRAMRRARAAETTRAISFAATIIINLAFLAWADRRVSRTATAREAAILETNRQKELLSTTLACIGDGVIVTDLEARITFLNAEAEHLTGWKTSEAIGQPVSSVFHIVNASSHQESESPVQKVLRSGVPTGLTNHTLLLSKNGAEFQIDDSAAPIRSQGGPLFGVVLVFRDITNQRHAEEARARLAAIVESSEDAIISKNLDGIVQTWNAGAERLFGYKPEEIIGKSVTLLAPGPPSGEEELIMRNLRERDKVERTETIWVAKDGRHIPVVLSASPVKDESGHVIGASQILHDATEIVAAREKLARGREELERVVKERTAKLQEMVTELQHVSYSITHDMRAPLRAMSAFAEMLIDQTSPSRPTPEEAKDYCQRIVRAAHRLDQLIVDALSYTKIVLQEVSLKPVSVTKIVRDLMDVYPHLQPDRADIRIEGTLPTVLGNESLLTQCFSNLLGNAVKFIEAGARPKVRLRAETNGAHARIWVEDAGIGIPKAAQKRLFGMYEKLDNRYEGTGIGLAIVRKVVERMGGTVGAESEPGQGSRFWVELRLASN